VMLRIGEPMYPSVHKRGFQPTTVRGPMGVAASASKLLGLDEESTIDAISIAGLMGGGLQAADRAPYPLFSLQIGRAAEAGILSALVAQAGLKGSDEILEAGFFSAFSDEGDFHLDSIGKGLGKDFAIAKTYIKMHYGCRHMHAPIDAALYLRNTHKIKWEDIERIKVKTYSTALAVCDIENPQTGRQAEYTINFGVVVALVHGDAYTDRFTDNILKTHPVQELLRRTTIEHDPELDKEHPRKWSTIVEITLKNGKLYSHTLDYARGEPESPFSKAEIENKFNEMASKALNKETRLKMIDFVDHLESKKNIKDLFSMFKATSPGARAV
jgi:2-methylcitrate dehydratase PrpD